MPIRPYLDCRIELSAPPGVEPKPLLAAAGSEWAGIDIAWDDRLWHGKIYVHDGVPLHQPVRRELQFVQWNKLRKQPVPGDRLGLAFGGRSVGWADVLTVIE